MDDLITFKKQLNFLDLNKEDLEEESYKSIERKIVISKVLLEFMSIKKENNFGVSVEDNPIPLKCNFNTFEGDEIYFISENLEECIRLDLAQNVHEYIFLKLDQEEYSHFNALGSFTLSNNEEFLFTMFNDVFFDDTDIIKVKENLYSLLDNIKYIKNNYDALFGSLQKELFNTKELILNVLEENVETYPIKKILHTNLDHLLFLKEKMALLEDKNDILVKILQNILNNMEKD